MKNIEQYVIKKITQNPMLWMFYIVGLFGLVSFIGRVIKASATSTNMAVFGIVLSVISFICMFTTLMFYKKHSLAK